jgi:hypothetical protein
MLKRVSSNSRNIAAMEKETRVGMESTRRFRDIVLPLCSDGPFRPGIAAPPLGCSTQTYSGRLAGMPGLRG